jgi:Prokaryotic E2 family A
MTQPKSMAQIGMAMNRGIEQLKAHSSIHQILDITENSKSQSIDVIAIVKVSLPNSWMAVGQSPNGVRSMENATFSFSPDFPIHAPKLTLRQDFDRSLAHVNPGLPGEPVSPCIAYGDLDELFHEQGLWAIVNQLVIWLENAALDRLINPEQGWEPIRRDHFEDVITADADALRELANSGKRYELRLFRYGCYQKSQKTPLFPKERIYFGRIFTKPWDPKFQKGLFEQQKSTTHNISGDSIALLVFPEPLPSGELPVVDRYLPETVTDLASLKERAKLWCCAKNLSIALSALDNQVRIWDLEGEKVPVVVVLFVKRPYPLISEDSDIELIPYLIEVSPPQTLPHGNQTPVFPIAHREAITQKLLQRFSGDVSIENRDTVLIGCGSLGSKIALHLARSGAAPKTLIDRSIFSPHNAARHALLFNGDYPLGISKASALAMAIQGLSQKSAAVSEDINTIISTRKLRQKYLPHHTWAIINTTASLTVREALASVPNNKLPSRIIETTLFANGTIGLLTVEGPDRNPNSADLIAETYTLIREDTQLRQAIFESDNPLRSRSVGQGCSSTTMIISDADISVMAAAMTQKIMKMRQEDLPKETGEINLASMLGDGFGLSWQTYPVPPAHVATIDHAPSWTVRVLDRAHQKILDDCARYPDVETGGILIGRLFEALQAFIITDVLLAPVDSCRSREEFILGTADVTTQLAQYSATCNHTLYCLGTWHSHLSDSGPSDRDWETAQKVAEHQSQPLVLLIRTPNNYRAIAAICH